MKETKIWGDTESLWQHDNAEVHRLNAVSGGFSSIHKHEYKYNYFYVESGELLIERWKEKNVIDKTILHKGESTIVPPNEYHRFTALKDSTAIEIYWTELNKFDIVRKNQGGIKKRIG